MTFKEYLAQIEEVWFSKGKGPPMKPGARDIKPKPKDVALCGSGGGPGPCQGGGGGAPPAATPPV